MRLASHYIDLPDNLVLSSLNRSSGAIDLVPTPSKYICSMHHRQWSSAIYRCHLNQCLWSSSSSSEKTLTRKWISGQHVLMSLKRQTSPTLRWLSAANLAQPEVNKPWGSDTAHSMFFSRISWAGRLSDLHPSGIASQKPLVNSVDLHWILEPKNQ